MDTLRSDRVELRVVRARATQAPLPRWAKRLTSFERNVMISQPGTDDSAITQGVEITTSLASTSRRKRTRRALIHSPFGPDGHGVVPADGAAGTALGPRRRRVRSAVREQARPASHRLPKLEAEW